MLNYVLRVTTYWSYLFILLVGFLITFSCKDKLALEEIEKQSAISSSSKEITEICDWADKITTRDQFYRKLSGMHSPFIVELVALDSLLTAANLSKDEFQALTVTEQEPIKEQVAKIVSTHEPFSETVQDSIRNLEEALDLDNTKQVLQKLEEIDYPKLNDFNCFEESLIVFVHTPYETELVEQVKQALESRKEFIDSERYRHIMWHLNGRKDEDG